MLDGRKGRQYQNGYRRIKVSTVVERKIKTEKSSHVPFNPPEGRIMLKAMLHCDIMHRRGKNYLIALINSEDYTMARRIKRITAESIRQVIISYIKISHKLYVKLGLILHVNLFLD